jgi:catechol 2,3-dioxygenase-like lactoylglutathione lyase family enzyme
MYSHTTIGANDLARARDFYDAVLAPLELEVRFSDDSMVGWGRSGGRPQFLVVRPFDGGEPSAGNGSMIALLASKRSLVDACHAAAMEQGGTDEGRPGLRPHYHGTYYGAYFRDLDGNKICIVSHHAE